MFCTHIFGSLFKKLCINSEKTSKAGLGYGTTNRYPSHTIDTRTVEMS